MRGRVNPQVTMLAFIDIESRIRLDHPLRTIKYVADEALAELSPVFDATMRQIDERSEIARFGVLQPAVELSDTAMGD